MLSSRRILQGSASNVARLFLSVAIALVLPPLLVRRLSAAEYSAWVLIVQLTSYVSLLDLGLQGVLGKLFAENHAKSDAEGNHRLLNTAFLVFLAMTGAGLCLIGVLVWRVPQLFHQMPPGLLAQVRLGLLLMGASAALSLPANPFLSTFTGLQEYGFPTLVALLSRAASAAVMIALVQRHGSLLQITAVVAAINVATALAQYAGWWHFVRTRIAFTLWRAHRATASVLLRTGGVIAIWTLGGLFVNGLDLTIVGHFDFAHTGTYALASNVTNFLLLLATSVLSPLLPAVSAMQATSTPRQIGDLTVTVTRYGTLLLVLLSVPILVLAHPLLTLWVGPSYAAQILPYLQLLILGNCIRQIAYPYSVVVIATGQQNLATLATVSEAVVNLAVSVWLARSMGASGVAIGTCVGALVSLLLHLAVSMRRTVSAIDMAPGRFLTKGLLLPLAAAAPLPVLVLCWKTGFLFPHSIPAVLVWIVVGYASAILFGLTGAERQRFTSRLQGLRSRFRAAAQAS